MLYLVFLPIKLAKTFSTDYNDQVCDQLPDLQDQKSLILY